MSCWDSYIDQRLRDDRAVRDPASEYSGLLAEARSNGFEPAPLSAILNLERSQGIYAWRGRLWVKSMKRGDGLRATPPLRSARRQSPRFPAA